VKRIDLRHLRQLLRIVSMMTDGMVRVRDADLRIGAIVLLARELECDDARNIRLKRQNLQVEHELRVIGELRRDSYRPIDVGNLRIQCCALGTLDLTLHFTNTIEVLIHAYAIGNADALLELRNVHAERIQQASATAQPGAPRGSIASLP